MNAAPAAALAAVAPAPIVRISRASTLLRIAGAAWLVVAVAGQLMFAAYVAGFYGSAAIEGRPEIWNRVLAHGYVPGDTLFNLVLSLHLLFAVAIVLGGALQLIARVRRTAPAIHRWNGRAYLAAAAIMSLGGVVMIWTPGTIGDLTQRVAISTNAALILAFAAIAWRNVRARRFDAHRRWALRLFLAVSGVWFFRVGLSLWLVVNGGPVGFDPKTFTGPFLTFLSFAQYLLPLAVLETYFLAERSRDPRVRIATAAMLAAMTLATAAGVAAATAVLWLPRFSA